MGFARHNQSTKGCNQNTVKVPDNLTSPDRPPDCGPEEWMLALWIADQEVWSRGLRPQIWEIENRIADIEWLLEIRKAQPL